jgi:DNA invertase Pin-like site-specific DNA recombinase
MAVIGYARVSTTEQDPQLQLDALKAAGAARVFIDHASGVTAARPQLIAALDYLREGDTLAVWRLDRLGRSLRDLIDQVQALEQRGVGLMSVTEALDTTTASGRLTFHVFGALAEFERELIRERTHAGLEAARQQGRTGGRPTVMTAKKKRLGRELLDDGLPVERVAAALKVSRATVYRHLIH